MSLGDPKEWNYGGLSIVWRVPSKNGLDLLVTILIELERCVFVVKRCVLVLRKGGQATAREYTDSRYVTKHFTFCDEKCSNAIRVIWLPGCFLSLPIKLRPAGMEKYTYREKISSGAFSDVILATNNDTRQKVALKIIHSLSTPDRVMAEAIILMKLGGKHNVVKTLGGFQLQPDKYVLVLEYFPHSPFATYASSLDVEGIRKYMTGLLESLAYIHANGICHRDVKPGNYLHEPSTGESMLVDFGLSMPLPKTHLPVALHTVKEGQGHPNPKIKLPKVNRAGTKGFRAPEVLMRSTNQSCAMDMWAAGMILLSIMVHKHPIFSPADDFDALKDLADLIGTKPLEAAGRSLSTHFLTLALPNHCLDRKVKFPYPVKAKSWKEACLELAKDKLSLWPDSMYELVEQCLAVDPCQRITAENALLLPFFKK